MSMRSRLRVPLRIFLRASPVAEPQNTPPGPPAVPVVGLTVYAGDSVAFGYVPLSAGRVTDLMNEHEDFEFADACLQGLEDGRELTLRTIVVAREEILAVGVAGPRGDPKRRRRTRPIPVELRVGPYEVRGNLHVFPGIDPISSFRTRRPMVPLTEATIEWEASDGRQIAQWGTVVVNRLLTEWIGPARRDVRPPRRQLVPELEGSGMARGATPRLLAE
ncbi:MAG: hypothetical protein ABIG85_06240 [Chloroflexota bacterium]